MQRRPPGPRRAHVPRAPRVCGLRRQTASACRPNRAFDGRRSRALSRLARYLLRRCARREAGTSHGGLSAARVRRASDGFRHKPHTHGALLRSCRADLQVRGARMFPARHACAACADKPRRRVDQTAPSTDVAAVPCHDSRVISCGDALVVRPERLRGSRTLPRMRAKRQCTARSLPAAIHRVRDEEVAAAKL